MTRVEELNEFTVYDGSKKYFIEPEMRRADVEERILDVIREYNPPTIVKAGIGEGSLLLSIARNFNGCMVVVDQSLARIKEFLGLYGEEDTVKGIRFIVGDFQDFPVDYYKADMLICIDFLNLVDSGKSIDEFRRALQFEGILFLGTVVLHNDDVEGVYDEFMHLLLPLHNDYYLEDDLKTFMDLKGFRFVKAKVMNYPRQVDRDIGFFEEYSGEKISEKAGTFMSDREEVLQKLYALNEEKGIQELYFVGYFARRKPA